jgi:hypothetical protein
MKAVDDSLRRWIDAALQQIETAKKAAEAATHSPPP